MARIQILELPTEHHGDDMVTPFVVIIDQAEQNEMDTIRGGGYAEFLKEKFGARAVIFTAGTLDIP